MKIIDKYMVRGFLAPFLWCVLLFNVMAIIIDIFSFIDDIVSYKIPGESIAAFYVYYLPTIFIQVTPMAVLLSSIFVLSNLNKHNEITAMKSSGISLWRILSPVLILGFIVSVVVFVVNDRIIPTSSRIANYIRTEELEKVKHKNIPGKIVKNVALYGAGNRIIFVRSYDTDKKLLNDIIVHEHDSAASLTYKITAQSGVWTGDGWRFYKVIVYKIDNSGKILEVPKFYDEKDVPLKERPVDFANKESRAEYMSYRQLQKYILNFRGANPRLIKNLLVDLHYKTAFPFISFVIILIGAPFAIITTRGGVLIGVGMSIVIGLLYYASIAIFIAFGKAGILPPIVAAWLGNVVFACIGIHLVNKRT